MTTDPIELLTQVIPDLFNAAVGEMRAAGEGGDADAKQRYLDLGGSPAAVRIVLEGKGGTDRYLVVEKATMRVADKAPAAPVWAAIALPLEAASLGLEEMESQLDAALPKLQKRLTRLAPKRAQGLIDRLVQEKLSFHAVLKDTPDFDEVRVKVAVGAGEPPEKPAFTVILDYDSFEELRSGKIKPQAIMGRLQITGDASRAMQLGMELMQRRS